MVLNSKENRNNHRIRFAVNHFRYERALFNNINKNIQFYKNDLYICAANTNKPLLFQNIRYQWQHIIPSYITANRYD
jgi:hypothetical protein